jgi:hypothetical protein
MGLKQHRKWVGSGKRAHTSHTERRAEMLQRLRRYVVNLVVLNF